MICIADSGSSKTDWLFINTPDDFKCQTLGINPVIHSKAFIEKTLHDSHDLKTLSKKTTQLFFYSAGCYSEKEKDKLNTLLSPFFQQANIVVEHDVLGAARALFFNQKGIACILGTGSNCTYYNGTYCTDFTDALGYILGDEGSGAQIGKCILKDYLYGNLPETIKKDTLFSGLNKEVIFDEIYKQKNPKRFLASFAKVLSHYKTEEYTKQTLSYCFKAFIHTHIKKVNHYQQLPIGVIGSIGYHYQKEFSTALNSVDLTLHMALQSPLEKLKEYHLNEI